MPATPTVEQLAATRTQPPKDVLQVWRRGRGGAQRGGIERPAGQREQSHPEKAAADLKSTVTDVLMWHSIAGEMQWRTQGERSEPRAG